MKKTLIALAALAATAGVAHAQSAVTLYGVADANFGKASGKATTGNVTTTNPSQIGINSGGLSGSRWGLLGSEDLGGGLATVFTLESGFDIDTGAGAGNLFGRVASVGLKGAFGEVRVGRQYTAYDALRGATNNTLDTGFAQTGKVWATGIQDYSGRASNSVRYDSPSIEGFSGAVAYGFGEDKTNTSSASYNSSLHVKYANGPLLVGYAYQREEAAAAVDSRKYSLLGASYDLGVVKLVGSYNTAKNTLLKDKEYQFGVSAPFGAASVAAGFVRAESEGVGSTNKGQGFSLLGTYDLSKRTTLYAGYYNTKVESGLNAATTTKNSLLATGIRHKF